MRTRWVWRSEAESGDASWRSSRDECGKGDGDGRCGGARVNEILIRLALHGVERKCTARRVR